MKVGAPPEVATLLEEIGKESYSSVGGGEIGADPELDEFMVTAEDSEKLLRPLPFSHCCRFVSLISSGSYCLVPC